MAGLIGVLGLPGIDTLEADARYASWLGLGFLDGNLRVLSGLPGRQILGATLALIVVAQLSLLIRSKGEPPSAREMAVGPGLCGFALLWTMSRTGVFGLVAGIVAIALPWHRLSYLTRRIAVVGLFALLAIAPLLGVATYQEGHRSTYQWRLQVWLELLQDPLFLAPFGRGPQEALVLGATHAHNLVMEVLALGGIAGLALFCLFAWVLGGLAARATPLPGKLLLGCFIAFAAIAATEMPLGLRSPSISSEFFILAVAAGATSRATARLAPKVGAQVWPS